MTDGVRAGLLDAQHDVVGDVALGAVLAQIVAQTFAGAQQMGARRRIRNSSRGGDAMGAFGRRHVSPCAGVRKLGTFYVRSRAAAPLTADRAAVVRPCSQQRSHLTNAHSKQENCGDSQGTGGRSSQGPVADDDAARTKGRHDG